MNLLKDTATVGGMTLISRVLGFVRDILLAAIVGAGPVADAFVVAFRFPNLFRRLFAEGAFNAAFVPLFAKHLEENGEDSARRFAEESLAVLLTALVVFTLVTEIFMPAVVLALAPGFVEDQQKFDLTVLFTRIALPYLLFMSLAALYSGLLNSLGKFAVAAVAPALLNVVLITALLVAAPRMPTAGHALVYGVVVAGAMQLLFVAWAAGRAGYSLRLRRPRLTRPVRRLIRLGVPGALSGGITQINIVIGTMIASMEAGAASYLYYAERVYQLPLGIIGIAMGVVLLPSIARQLRAGRETQAHNSQNRALELSMLLTLPAAAALLAIPMIIVMVLFEHGAFDHESARSTAKALGAFAAGLPAFVLIKVFSPGFFAREDTRTPMIYAAISVAVNVILSLILFTQIGFLGIPIATTLASWVNAVLLGLKLLKLGYFKADARLTQRLPRILIASILMGVGLHWAVGAALPLAPPVAAAQMLVLAGLVLGGLAVYGGLALSLGAARLQEVRGLFSKGSAQK